jgi:hypothetical protein
MLTIKKFIDDITNIIGTAVANLFLTLAVVIFFWAVINFIIKRAQGASESMKQARDMLGWSIIGLFVMFSIWGIIYFFQSAFQIQNSNSISAPSIRVNTSNGTAGASTNPSSLSTKLQLGEGCGADAQCASSACNIYKYVCTTPSNRNVR